MTNGHRSINNIAKRNRLAGWRSLDLLQKRAYLSKQVAKAKQGGTIFYPLREKEIVAKLQELNLSASGEEKKQVLPSEASGIFGRRFFLALVHCSKKHRWLFWDLRVLFLILQVWNSWEKV